MAQNVEKIEDRTSDNDAPSASIACGIESSWAKLREALAKSLPEEVLSAAGTPAGWASACEEMAAGLPHLAESFPEVIRDWLLPRVGSEAEAILREAQRQRTKRLYQMWRDLPDSERKVWEGKASRARDEYADLLHEWRCHRLQDEPKRPQSAYFLWVRSKYDEFKNAG